MPCDYGEYPANWKTDIRPRILERAGHRCEWCGVENYAMGARDQTGRWRDAADIPPGEGSKRIKIVLTIAHIDHDKTNNDDENLRALCQRCHLNHDRDHHRANAAATRRQKKQQALRAAGQMELF